MDKNIPAPKYMREGDAAFDLYSGESYTLKPMEWKLFGTTIKMEIPRGYIGNIRDRSGLAVKFAIHTMAGIIDSGFRGEVGVVLINLSSKDFVIEKGMRIAQMIIQAAETVEFVEVDELSEAERNHNSFGSTGLF